jgi:hypothetical protein
LRSLFGLRSHLWASRYPSRARLVMLGERHCGGSIVLVGVNLRYSMTSLEISHCAVDLGMGSLVCFQPLLLADWLCYSLRPHSMFNFETRYLCLYCFSWS